MTGIQATERPRVTPSAFLHRFRTRHASWIPVLAALAILIAMLLGAQAYFGNFITPRVLSALLLDNAYLIVLAVGMTFVILTGGIDLSVGAVMAFTGMLGASLLRDGIPTALVIPTMLLVGSAMGLVVGILVQYFDVQPFIASLAVMFAARGLAFLVNLKSIRVEDPAILWLQSTRLSPGPGSFYLTPTGIIALLAVLVGGLVLAYTRFGRTIYALGGNEQSARLMGLPVVRTKVLAYVVSGLCAGLAGVVYTAYSGAAYPLNGIGTELDTIAAVVIGGASLSGGVGRIPGTVVGVLIIGVLRNGLNLLSVSPFVQQIVIGVVIALAVMVDVLRRDES